MGCIHSQPDDPLARAPGGASRSPDSATLDINKQINLEIVGHTPSLSPAQGGVKPPQHSTSLNGRIEESDNTCISDSATGASASRSHCSQQRQASKDGRGRVTDDDKNTEHNPALNSTRSSSLLKGLSTEASAGTDAIAISSPAAPLQAAAAAAAAAPEVQPLPEGLARNVQRLHALLQESQAQILDAPGLPATVAHGVTRSAHNALGPASVGAGKVRSANILGDTNPYGFELLNGGKPGSQQFYDSCESQMDRIAAKLAHRMQRSGHGAGAGRNNGQGPASAARVQQRVKPNSGGPSSQSVRAAGNAQDDAVEDAAITIPSLANQLPTYTTNRSYHQASGARSSTGTAGAGAAGAERALTESPLPSLGNIPAPSHSKSKDARGGAAGNQGNHVGSRVDAKGAGSGAGRGSPLMVTESLSGISERVVDVYQ